MTDLIDKVKVKVCRLKCPELAYFGSCHTGDGSCGESYVDEAKDIIQTVLWEMMAFRGDEHMPIVTDTPPTTFARNYKAHFVRVFAQQNGIDLGGEDDTRS